MSESHGPDTNSTPWHLWVIGIVALLWNSMGAMDYVMSQLRIEAYMSGFTPEQLAFFYSMPTWAIAAWATGVWAGVGGSIALLFRRLEAVWLYLASFIGVVVTNFQNYVLSNWMEVAGDAFTLAFAAVIFLVALGLYIYARAMRKRQVLV